MKIMGDKMMAGELKGKILKKAFFDKVQVIGKLEPVCEGECDHYYHGYDNEQIPVNVGIFIGIKR